MPLLLWAPGRSVHSQPREHAGDSVEPQPCLMTLTSCLPTLYSQPFLDPVRTHPDTIGSDVAKVDAVKQVLRDSCVSTTVEAGNTRHSGRSG
jgi:hypothetical protein